MTALETGTDDLLAEVDDGVAVLTMNRPSGATPSPPRCSTPWPASRGGRDRRRRRVRRPDRGRRGVLRRRRRQGHGRGGDGGTGAATTLRRRRPPPAAQPAGHQRAACTRCPSRRSPRCPAPPPAAGLSLALACDLRYAAPTAVLTTAFAKVGFAGDYGGTWFLTRLVGSAKARELYYFSERLDAPRSAEPRASSTASSPPDELRAEVRHRARRLADGPTRRLPVHEGEPQPRRARRARRVPRHGG